MSETARIEELRRRVQSDPTSIAFAALAEEYRRAGHYEEAVEVCRNGLNRHPQYLSARVTLGRALIELNQLEEAKMELDQVLSIAPENLAATRALAEIHARRGEPFEPAADVAAPPPAGYPAFELDLVGPHASSSQPQLEPHAEAVPDAPHAPVLTALNRLLDAVRSLKSHSA